MKHLKQVTTVFIAALISSNTFAHNLMKDAALPHQWTGFYAGANAGAVKHTMSITDNQASSFNATLQLVPNPAFTGGLQIGYRRQLDLNSVSGVYGLEFSVNSSNAAFKQNYGSDFALYHLSAENELNNFCLLQLMGGIAADKTLLFLAAGISWVNISGSVVNLATVPFFHSFNLDKKVFGTALGGGIEYAFTPTISLRFKVDVITPSTYTVADGVGDNFQIANNIVQGTIGINYTFA